jgi:hypothetical protein
MTVSKNLLLAAGATIVVVLVGTVGFILLKPQARTTARPTRTIATPTPTATVRPVGSNQKIKLTVDTADGLVVKTNKLAIKGTTAPQAEVFVNDLDLKADAAGLFAGTLTLEEGANPISVTAVDDAGNSAETELTVNYEP